MGPMKKEYLTQYTKWMNDPEMVQYLGMIQPMTRENEEEWYENARKNKNAVYFAILLINGDIEELIGNCGVDIDWKNKLGDLGITIGEKDQWGKGYGTEAMQLLVNYCFHTLNLHKVKLNVYDFNTRAIKSYRKIGFIKEGNHRKSHYVNGKYVDLFAMGLLKDEWKQKRENA
ncbi:GNAT family N-acetyltransferase [Promethearchaeum syntrophicum]|uniref:GNAT family N-acetyltransferase n=1 Tax=Promethearchaeum syntrophicum TaxID=2594042 RepID=A0A5B9D9E1_9ARCH|nr:GNAT family protein [Candidatus Prometheoarchaeum syntrophicum]